MGDNLTVRALTEGALMASLSALLGIIGIYIPVLAIFTSLIWTIPIILLIMRHNLKVGIMGLVVAGALISILAGPAQGLLIVVKFGGMGLVYGYCFKKKISPLKNLFFGTVIAAVSAAVTIILLTFVANLPVTQLLSDIKQVLDETFKIYQQKGMLNRILPPGFTPEQYKQWMFQFINTMLPAMFITASMVIALVNYIIGRKVLEKLKYDIPEMPLFRNWHFPWYIVWGVILGLILLLGGNHFSNRIMSVIGQNILYIYYPLLLVSGISVIVYYWKSYRFSGFIKVLIILSFLMFGHFAFLLVLLIGLFDPLFDYRQFIRSKPDK